ncbi:hypothetical protein BKA62DRAFT_715544 [Auriculariales sp. MPI-PUGE-AT-0066]|nr:hypothetical protein BKA62DRAFT_715544 [Auriculariales sp. MPI-PUGE-AT-0066]
MTRGRLTEALRMNEICCQFNIRYGSATTVATVFNAAGKLNSNCSPWQQLVRNLREAMLARVERNFADILIEAALDQAQEARDTGSNTMHAFATAALHRTILSLALCSRNQNMNTLVTCIVLLGRSLAAMRLDSDARAVLTWGAEWAARADFMLESAKALVALARLTSETTAVTDKIHEAWKLALDAARGADMGALVAECESQLT